MKNILIVIDVQKGFIVNEHTRIAKQRICELLEKNVFDDAIVTIYENYEGSSLIRFMGWNDFLGEDERLLEGEPIKACKNVIVKKKYSAYGSNILDKLKEINDGKLPEQVYLCGIDTACCVLATAVDFFENGIRPIVLAEYCGSTGDDLSHHAGILSMRQLIGKNNIYCKMINSRNDLNDVISQFHDIDKNKEVDEYNLSVIVVNKLIDKHMTISFAESCTGGMATAKLVDIPSASKVLNASVVTYANQAKMDYLNVDSKTLEEFGAVSENVAREMAIGIANRNNANVGVGISGIAGPSGGTDKKPVGMVCFGFYIDKQIYTYTQYFGNIGRNEVRRNSVDFVYRKLNELL